MQPGTAQSAPTPEIRPPPAESRLCYESTAEGITVRSVPPAPTAAILASILIVFIPSAIWAIAYTNRNKAPFNTFLVLVLIAVAITLLATSSLIAFFRRLARPPTWHITDVGLSATKSDTFLRKRFHFRRSEIVTVRSDESALQVITQRAGQWRAHSFPLLTAGGGWLAELIATRLNLSPLPHQYLMTRTPDDTSPDQITYGFEGTGPRYQPASTGVRSVPPEGELPADASIQIRRNGTAWTVTRPPPGWFERIAVWTIAASGIVTALYWVAVKGPDGLGAVFSLLVIWAIFGQVARDRFARTCGPTVLTHDDDTLHLVRPTGWGTRRQTIHWWMIRSIDFYFTIRRGRPLAAMRLHTKTHRTIHLFTSLPERDARWVAALIAGTFAMEEAQPTWTPQVHWTMRPR